MLAKAPEVSTRGAASRPSSTAAIAFCRPAEPSFRGPRHDCFQAYSALSAAIAAIAAISASSVRARARACTHPVQLLFAIAAARAAALLAHVVQLQLTARCLHLAHVVASRVERLPPPVRAALDLRRAERVARGFATVSERVNGMVPQLGSVCGGGGAQAWLPQRQAPPPSEAEGPGEKRFLAIVIIRRRSTSLWNKQGGPRGEPGS